jgi:hypothetical protein
MRAVETIPGTRGKGDKGDDGGMNSSMIYCKKFCVTMHPKYNNNKK